MVSRHWIELTPTVLKGLSPNHWTAREFRFVVCFILNSLTEVSFIYHKIHSIAQPSPKSNFKTFPSSPKHPWGHFPSSLFPFQPLATTKLLSASLDLPFLPHKILPQALLFQEPMLRPKTNDAEKSFLLKDCHLASSGLGVKSHHPGQLARSGDRGCGNRFELFLIRT